jgi:colicin import membrane protein
MEFELVVVEKLNPVEIFSDGGVDKILNDIETKALSIVTDVSTPVGRRDIASLAFKVARSKTLLDDMGKVMVDDAKKKVKTMDAHRKTIRDTLDALKEKVRAPLTEWEAEEDKRRIAAEQKARERAQGFVDAFTGVGVSMPFMLAMEMSDGDFFAKFTIAEDEYKKEQARIAEEKRVEQERLSADKKAREEEAAKLAKERADLERVQAEVAALQAKSEAKLKAESDRLDAERNAFAKAKLEQEQKYAIEQAKKEATEKALKDAAEKAQREAAEKEEAEQRAIEEAARQERLRPDKEKVLAYANALSAVPVPECASEEAVAVIAEAAKKVNAIKKYLIKCAL